jgi:DNA-binding transcriptional ArsR family regulator
LSDDKETYSTIFTALRHPLRQRILRMLATEPLTFTAMLHRLGIESPHLTYHLESLGILLAKTKNGQYQLSTFGRAAIAMMGWVEEAPQTEAQPVTVPTTWKTAVVLLVVGIAIFAGSYYGQHQISEMYLDYSQLSKNYTQIKAEYLSTVAPTAITPPISKLEAIHIALTHGGWNRTMLQDLFVTADLCYVELTVTPQSKRFDLVYYVTEAVLDYSPVRIGDTTYRYVWYIIITQQGFTHSIPPPGCYLVDVTTGEVPPTPFDRYNPLVNE